MKVLLATPTYDRQVLSAYHSAVLGLYEHFHDTRPEVRFHSLLLPSSLVQQARNAFATIVLRDRSFSHLLFVDADMGFQPSLIEKMLDFGEPFVGCIAPRRRYEHERLHQAARMIDDPLEARLVAHGYIGGDGALKRGADGEFVARGDFLQAERTGTGILLLRREVIERLHAAYPQLASADPKGHYAQYGIRGGVFQPFESLQDETGMFLGEDYAFCRRWTETGGEIWSCFNETIIHTGREDYLGDYSRRLKRRS